MKWHFPHPYLENLSLNVGPFTQLIGHDQELKYYIWQLLEWYFGGKKYSEEDLALFQQIEPVIRKDLEPIKRSFYRFLAISDVGDLIEQMTYRKGTVAFDYVKKKSNCVDIAEPLEEINDLLDIISLRINQVLDLGVGETSYYTDSHHFTLEQLLSKNFSPYFRQSGQTIAFEFVANESKLLFFLDMLEELLKEDTSPVLLMFKNMDDYLTYSSFKVVCQHLENLTKAYPYLQVIIIPSSEGYLHLNQEVMTFINIFGDFRVHLQELEFMYHRFSLHYPSTNIPSLEEFCSSLQKNASYLLCHQLEQVSLSVRDLVAIKILNQLYHYDVKLDYQFSIADQLEINFLIE